MPDDIKEETTNAVLSTKIDGLSKLTDERFLNIKESLNRIELHSTSYALKVEVEEIKKDFNKIVESIRQGMEQHNKDDKESFGGISAQVSLLNKTVWIGMGVLSAITFFIQVILPYWVEK